MGSCPRVPERAVSSPLRVRLEGLLASAVDRHHLVVWQDASGEYAAVAEGVVPADAAFARYEGSWFELRHHLEANLALADPPRLVVYVGAAAPPSDPLAELRAASHRFEVPLRDLVRQGLDTHLAVSQIDAIADAATTFSEAEAAAGTGVGPGLISLVPILGAGLSDVAIIVEVLGAVKDAGLDAKAAWGDVHRLVERVLGITTTEVHDALRQTIARVLLLAAVEHADVLPERLRTALPLGTEAQKEARYRALDEWWARYPGTAAAAFAGADKTTRLADDTPWADALDCVDVAPSVDTIALGGCWTWSRPATMTERSRSRPAERTGGGHASLSSPLRSMMARQAAGEPRSRWQICGGTLLPTVHPRPRTAEQSSAGTAPRGGVLTALTAGSSSRSTGLAEHGALEQPVAEARAAYEDWLGSVIERYTGALEASGFSNGGLLRQAEVFPKFVKTGDVPTAYIWVDAFRFELATDVAESLRGDGQRGRAGAGSRRRSDHHPRRHGQPLSRVRPVLRDRGGRRHAEDLESPVYRCRASRTVGSCYAARSGTSPTSSSASAYNSASRPFARRSKAPRPSSSAPPSLTCTASRACSAQRGPGLRTPKALCPRRGQASQGGSPAGRDHC